MRVLRTLFFICHLSLIGVAAYALSPGAEEELLSQIRKNHIDAKAIYRVRELPLTRDDVRFYFNEGVLAFLEPIQGRVTGALFVGEGEILLMPPDPTEKRHLARFTGAPVLNEKFSAAFMRFGDDTGAQLAAALKGHSLPENRDWGAKEKADLIDEWAPVIQNLDLVFDLRLLDDLLMADHAPEPAAGGLKSMGHGFFLAHLSGQKLGAFDVQVDPLAAEQISAGQINWTAGRRFNDSWLSFVAGSVRNKQRAPFPEAGVIRSYKIDSTINPDHNMEVTASVAFDATSSGERMLAFQLSRFLKVSSVELGGVKLQTFQNEGLRPEEMQRGNDVVTILLPAPLEKGRRYNFTFHYAGGVIADAGHGVLFVGARGIWYPQRARTIADYDMSFRFPRKLSLGATGERLDQHDDGEWRVSHWKSQTPLLVAGFNIGDYEEAQTKTADGLAITVYANRELEPALAARRPASVINDAPMIGFPARRRTDAPPLVVPPPPPPTAAILATDMARDLAPVAEYFTKQFGPLPYGSLRVSPIPGSFGQGWPGLIYLSTLSYLVPYDSGTKAPESEEIFFRSLLVVHELAHQWWGHLVRPDSYRDEWLSEALASYSALLWLEQKDKNGARKVHEYLNQKRQLLLAKHDDETAESAGPLVLGSRLNNSRTADGAVHIYYDKGPWVIHMLRQVMRDPKTGSDAAFMQFLRTLAQEYSHKPLTTAAFREVAERFVSPSLNAEDGKKGHTLEWFFEQWVDGSGIPEIKVEAKVIAAKAPVASKAGAAKRAPIAAAGKIAGTATLNGVEDSWVVPVPIYVQTPRGEVLAGVAIAAVAGGAEDVNFTIPLPPGGQKPLVDPQQTLLAIFK